MSNSTEVSLVRSLSGSAIADLMSTVGDTALDAAIKAGALDGVPVIGMLTRGVQAAIEIRRALFVRKVAMFLKEFSATSPEERSAFVAQFRTEDEQFKFGETILLLLDRAEDMSKPVIVGRLMAAAARGNLNLSDATRLSKMVDRSYSEDLSYLKTFRPGTQRRGAETAAALYAAGFLSFSGIDGGEFDDDESGGVIYDFNRYGKMFVAHGFPQRPNEVQA